jgi:hypothetical protein
MLRCAECGRLEEGDTLGWRGLLGTDLEAESEPVGVYVICPECADREFGPSRKDSGEPANRSNRTKKE